MQIDEPIIETQSLIKRFGSITAVDQVSFFIQPGEVFGLLGPNGAGKTTTIRLLTGIINPDSGRVLIDGEDLYTQLVRNKLRMGVIPELGNVYGDLSALQNIILTGKFYGYRKKELKARAEDLLERFQLQERKDEPVRTFSKGLRQRVNIASALVHDPEILFLDEPTSGLDVKSQRLIKEIIRSRNRRGITVVLTTHNIEEANNLCNRVCIINRGRVVAVDSPENLKKTCESVRSVDVGFDRPVTDTELQIDGCVSRIEKLGDKWKLYTGDPDRVVKHLVELADRQELSIATLAICQASLEDVFVALTEGKYDNR